MNRIIYPLCVWLTLASVYAQTDTIRYRRSVPVILKLAPLWLLDTDPALAGGLEIRTGPRTSLQGEFGYGRPGWGDLSHGYQHAGTWRMKAEIRVYRNRYRVIPRKNSRVLTTYPLGNYWAVEAYAKVLNINYNWAPIFVGDPLYPLFPAPVNHTLIRRNSLSLTGKIGRQFGWTDNRHQGTARLLWDIYVGAGGRLIHQDNGGDQGKLGYMNPTTGIFNRFATNGFRIVPTLTAGVKLDFAL